MKSRIYTYATALMIAAADTLAVTPWMQSVPEQDAVTPQVVILSPANETTIFDNEGNVPVWIRLSPALANSPNGHVELLLNGKPVEDHDGEFVLTGIERGEHELQARVVDAGGGIIAESEPVRFYMWQASRLFPGRR